MVFGFLAAHAKSGNTISYTNEGIHEIKTNNCSVDQQEILPELVKGSQYNILKHIHKQYPYRLVSQLLVPGSYFPNSS